MAEEDRVEVDATPDVTDDVDDVASDTNDDAAPIVDGLPAAGDAADEEPSELDAARRERDEYLDAVRRVQADFENYRKRTLREQTAYLERATESLIEQLLPVLDAFELALLNVEGDPDKLRKGVELVYSELLGVLEKAGLERIEATGKPFDPIEHEAVMQVEGDGSDPVVADVMRSGYRLKGRVLRPAMVKVAK
jgi:molecular chaperone GrpE